MSAVASLPRLAWKSVAMRWTGYGGGGMGGTSGYFGSRWLSRFLPGSHYDYEAEAGRLWKNSVVAICLEWIRKNAPEPRLTVEVRRGTEWVEDPEAEVLEGLEEPNTGYSDDVLWAATWLSLTVDGNAYWFRAKNALGRYSYWWIPHWQMYPRYPSDGTVFISHYEHVVDGKIQRLEVDEVIHFRVGVDPDNERLGMAALKALLREVCTDNDASGMSASLCRNMGLPGVIIQPASDTDEVLPDDRADLEKTWGEKFTGDNRGKPLVPSVRMEVLKVSLSPNDMALDKMRELPEARICAAIGLSPSILNLPSGKGTRTFSNLSQDNRQAYQNCLIPMLKSAAKDFQRQSQDIMGSRRDERLVWKFDQVEALREDQTELAKRAVIAFTGGITRRNESRLMMGLPPDTAPEGEEYCKLVKPTATTATIGTETAKGEEAA